MNQMAAPKRILIVDDNQSIINVLSELLVTLGYEVETATDGYEALLKLVLDIDLILLDITMPRMDGFEVATRIRSDERNKDLPIIFITGQTSTEDRLRAVEVGGNDFIAKPFDALEVQVRVASLLRIKQAADEIKYGRDQLELTVAKRTADLRSTLDNLVESQRQIRNAQLETIQCLVTVAEFKDIGTAKHIKRMSLFSELLARKINLPPSEVELINYASPMHDIGKIGTPEDILMKRDKLTNEEFDIIKKHTVYGSKILTNSASELLQVGEVIALTHHERWDGGGYPNGLSGENIPLYGRICSIADVFDALTSVRPYKVAFSNKEAMELIIAGRRKQFDPMLVDVFSENHAEIEKIQAINR